MLKHLTILAAAWLVRSIRFRLNCRFLERFKAETDGPPAHLTSEWSREWCSQVRAAGLDTSVHQATATRRKSLPGRAETRFPRIHLSLLLFIIPDRFWAGGFGHARGRRRKSRSGSRWECSYRLERPVDIFLA
jgi:hypothetical protein